MWGIVVEPPPVVRGLILGTSKLLLKLAFYVDAGNRILDSCCRVRVDRSLRLEIEVARSVKEQTLMGVACRKIVPKVMTILNLL